MPLFQSNLRKQIRKLPKIQNSEICENYSLLFIIIHYYSFVSLEVPRGLRLEVQREGQAARHRRAEERVLPQPDGLRRAQRRAELVDLTSFFVALEWQSRKTG